MAVNTAEITSVYTSLLSSMISNYDTMWNDNKIDAETYTNLVGAASAQLINLSAELVQKQEQIDKDVIFKEAQIEEVYTSTSKIDAEIANIKAQKDLKLLDSQLSIWANLYGNSKVVNTVDPIATSEIEAVFDRVNQ